MCQEIWSEKSSDTKTFNEVLNKINAYVNFFFNIRTKNLLLVYAEIFFNVN